MEHCGAKKSFAPRVFLVVPKVESFWGGDIAPLHKGGRSEERAFPKDPNWVRVAMRCVVAPEWARLDFSGFFEP